MYIATYMIQTATYQLLYMVNKTIILQTHQLPKIKKTILKKIKKKKSDYLLYI